MTQRQTTDTVEIRTDHTKVWSETRTNQKSSMVIEPLLVLAVGVVIALLAINGRRLGSFTLPGGGALNFDVKVDPSTKEKLDVSMGDVSPLDRESVGSATDVLASISDPAKVTLYGESYEKYLLTEVPTSVIVDALRFMREQGLHPSTLAQFEYALRKLGPGNHAWLVRFTGKDDIWVAYGGRGKNGATVYWDKEFPPRA